MTREIYQLTPLMPNPTFHPQFPERVSLSEGGVHSGHKTNHAGLKGLELAIALHEAERRGKPGYGPTPLSSQKTPFNGGGKTGLELAIAAHEHDTANDPAYANGNNSVRPVALSAEDNARLIMDILDQYPGISGADLVTTLRRLQSGRRF